MKKLLFLFAIILLIGFVSAGGTNYFIEDWAKRLSYVSYYNFDDPSGDIVDRYRGKYNNTYILNMNYYNDTALFYKSVYFNDDLSHYFFLNESATATSTMPNNNFSIIVWVYWKKSLGDSATQRIWQQSATNNDFQIQTADGVILYTPSGGTSLQANNTLSNTTSYWAMFTYVCNNGTTWELYLNDTLILRNNTLGCINPTTAVRFASESTGNRNFAGNIENLIVLNQSINYTTVALFYNRSGPWFSWNIFGLYNYTIDYNTITYERKQEKYYLNISYNSSYWTDVDAYLLYNGTPEDEATKSGSLNFRHIMNAPEVVASRNITFYWVLNFYNGTSSPELNLEDQYQYVYNITIDSCTAGSINMMNLTLQDEETKSYFNSSYKAYNASIEVDIDVYAPGDAIPFLSYVGRFNYTNNVSICINRNLTDRYYTYSQIKYYADSYETEYYYIQNASITNASVPINITLFDLLSVDSTTFLVTYKDSSYLGIENALLVLKRKYVSDGVYRTVEIAATDENGQGILHLDTNGVDYAIEVYKDGTLLSTFDNIVAYCEDSVIGNCKINLYASASVTEADNFYTSRNIGYSVSFNQSNKVATLNYVILDGSSSTVSINITKLDTYMNATLCSSDIEGSSGTLSCDVNTSYGNTTFLIEIYKDNELIASEAYSIIEKATDIFGDNTIVLILAQFLTLAFMMLPSFIGVMIALILGLIISVGLFLLSGSIFGSAASIAWMIIAIIILIIKFHNRGTS